MGIMFGTKMTFWITTIAIGSVLFVGWKLTARGNYETAAYQLIDSEGAFELRDYPEIMLVTTDMAVASNGNDGSFGRLFQYISGSNELGQKVKMTTPVFMESNSAESNGTMGFVIPQKVAKSTIPQPTGSRVEIEKRTAGKYAVMRFNGRLNQRTQADSEAKLIDWIEKQGWEREDGTEFAGYDPPWTPKILRRNETLIRLK
ncbi:heme-binding protein [bacterium]|nr:heme-binding protein [bacterium]